MRQRNRCIVVMQRPLAGLSSIVMGREDASGMT